MKLRSSSHGSNHTDGMNTCNCKVRLFRDEESIVITFQVSLYTMPYRSVTRCIVKLNLFLLLLTGISIQDAHSSGFTSKSWRRYYINAFWLKRDMHCLRTGHGCCCCARLLSGCRQLNAHVRR